MRICFVVNRTNRQTETHTTLHLAYRAAARGHEVWYLDADRFRTDGGGRVGGWAFPAQLAHPGETRPAFAQRVADVGRGAPRELDLESFDVLFLRNNPFDGGARRDVLPGNPALAFARVLEARGVLVVNAPDGIARGASKGYLATTFPQAGPRSIVTRSLEDIDRFVAGVDAPVVVKPTEGYGGEGVFLLEPGRDPNRRSIIEALREHGYLVAQEFIDDPQGGDRRLLLLDGEPLEVSGHPAVYRRRIPEGDFRANLAVGGAGELATLTDADRQTCALLRDGLRAAGLYFVGVDLLGDRVIELNVHAPGGIHNVNRFHGVDCAAAIVSDLEARVAHDGERS